MSAYVLTWLRFLVVVLSLQVGGFVLAYTMNDPCADESGCCSDCPLEGTGNECPPGCPDCHCHHGAAGAASIPVMVGQELALPLRCLDTARACPHGANAPREPILSGLFRPPRARALLT